jgi:hypothetical protein
MKRLDHRVTSTKDAPISLMFLKVPMRCPAHAETTPTRDLPLASRQAKE